MAQLMTVSVQRDLENFEDWANQNLLNFIKVKEKEDSQIENLLHWYRFGTDSQIVALLVKA